MLTYAWDVRNTVKLNYDWLAYNRQFRSNCEKTFKGHCSSWPTFNVPQTLNLWSHRMDKSSPKAYVSNSTHEANTVHLTTLAATHTVARSATLSIHCTRVVQTTSVNKTKNPTTHFQHTSEINPLPLKRIVNNNSLTDNYLVIQPLPTPVNVNVLCNVYTSLIPLLVNFFAMVVVGVLTWGIMQK